MRKRLVEKALPLGGRMRDVVTISSSTSGRAESSSQVRRPILTRNGLRIPVVASLLGPPLRGYQTIHFASLVSAVGTECPWLRRCASVRDASRPRQRRQISEGVRRHPAIGRSEACQAAAAFTEPQRLRRAFRAHRQGGMPGAVCPRRIEIPLQGAARVRSVLYGRASASGHWQLSG